MKVLGLFFAVVALASARRHLGGHHNVSVPANGTAIPPAEPSLIVPSELPLNVTVLPSEVPVNSSLPDHGHVRGERSATYYRGRGGRGGSRYRGGGGGGRRGHGGYRG